MSTTIMYVTLTLLAVAAAHMALLARCAVWHAKNVDALHSGKGETPLARTNDGLAKYEQRTANPPWYARYIHWITRDAL
jgi:hypothetical protein